MEHLSDIELVDKANRGDSEALESLFQRHYLTVYRLSYKWCGNKADAEDITQEVFIKLVRKLHTFGRRSSFKTWLYRITMNAAKDFVRKRAGRDVHEASYEEDRHSDNTDPRSTDARAAVQLTRAIGQLPTKQRAAVLLVYGEGLTHREAGKILECREKTISWRVFQARKRLRITLDRESV